MLENVARQQVRPLLRHIEDVATNTWPECRDDVPAQVVPVSVPRPRSNEGEARAGPTVAARLGLVERTLGGRPGRLLL